MILFVAARWVEMYEGSGGMDNVMLSTSRSIQCSQGSTFTRLESNGCHSSVDRLMNERGVRLSIEYTHTTASRRRVEHDGRKYGGSNTVCVANSLIMLLNTQARRRIRKQTYFIG